MKFLLRMGMALLAMGILFCTGGLFHLALLALLVLLLPVAVLLGGIGLMVWLFTCAVFFVF